MNYSDLSEEFIMKQDNEEKQSDSEGQKRETEISRKKEYLMKVSANT